MIWLSETRGYLTDWITQEWVCLTGKAVDLKRDSWLHGSVGKTTGIGKDYFDELAREAGLEVRRGNANAGLVADFDALATEKCDVRLVHRGVRDFYEHTAAYDLDAWAEWTGLFRPFGKLLAWLFSRRLQQLNVPLSGLDTSRGITSEIVQLVEPNTDQVSYTGWVRQLIGSGNVLYAGSYSLCQVPGYEGLCVKVVFPLPNGNAIVMMRPEVHPDGSFSVVSSGERFGDPGFYFTVHRSDKKVYARYVRPMQERIHVYEATDGKVHADHTLTLWGLTFLRLHYRLTKREENTLIVNG